jgi:DnaK suppressor protein
MNMAFSYKRAKQELLEERAKLKEQLEWLGTAEYESIGYSNHMADDATEAFDQAVGVALQRKVEATLDEVGQALTKFEDGTYGICEICGARIDRARLEALPYARYCLDCQARHEHGRTRKGSR